MKALFGFNMTNSHSLSLVNRLYEEGVIDYVEVLIDNFINFLPAAFNELKPPLAIHIMSSRFLERESQFLKLMSDKIRTVTDGRDIFYYSDHILKFSHKGFTLPYLQEIDYEMAMGSKSQTVEKIKEWSNLLGSTVYFENAASLDSRGLCQHKFIKDIVQYAGGKTLLDLTNLYISINNGGAKLEDWEDIISSSRVFHIGSYSFSTIDQTLMIDSHASQITREFIDFVEGIIPYLTVAEDIFVTYERDANNTIEAITIDISRCRELFEKI